MTDEQLIDMLGGLKVRTAEQLEHLRRWVWGEARAAQGRKFPEYIVREQLERVGALSKVGRPKGRKPRKYSTRTVEFKASFDTARQLLAFLPAEANLGALNREAARLAGEHRLPWPRNLTHKQWRVGLPRSGAGLYAKTRFDGAQIVLVKE